MRKKFLDAFLSALILGFMPLLTKTLYSFGSTPLSSVFYRLLLAIPVLGFLTLRISKTNLKISLKEFFLLMLSSICFIGCALCLYYSYNYINSGSTTAIHYTYPILIFIATMFIKKEKPNFIEVVCITLCTIALMLFLDFSDLSKFIGVLYAFVSSIFYSTYSLIVDITILKKMENSKILFFINTFGSIFLLIFSKLTSIPIYTGFIGFQWIFVFFFSMVLMTATFLYQRSVLKIGSKYTSIISTFEPINSLIVGFLFLQESIYITSLISIVLIIVANIFLIRASKD